MGNKRRLVGFRWTLAVTVCALAATAAASLGLAQCLICREDALWQGELWRLFSGPLVHASWGHALRDAAILLLVGALYEARLGQRYVVALVASTALAPLVVFAVDPTITLFLGLSGTVHAVLAVSLIDQCLRRHRSWWVLGLIGALVAKVAVETVTGTPLVPIELAPGTRPAVVAHLAGLACGVLAAALPERRRSATAIGRRRGEVRI